MDAVEYKNCLVCGKEFGITPQQRRKKYCDACQKDAYKKKMQEYWQKPGAKEHKKEYDKQYRSLQKIKHPSKYICALCGKEFVHNLKGKPKYCVSCLLERRYEQPYKEYLERRTEIRELMRIEFK